MTSTNRALVFALIPIFLLLGLVGGLAIFYTQSLREKQDWIIHTYRVINNADTLLSELRQGIGAQRGYLLTGKEVYIDPYHEGERRTLESLKNLRALTGDNARQVRRVERLHDLVTKRFELLQKGIDIRRAQGLEASGNYIGQDVGRVLMNEIVSVVENMTNEEEILLQNRSRDAAGLEDRTTMTTFSGAALALVFLLFIAVLLLRNNLRLARAERTLAEKATLLQATLDNIRDGIAAFDAKGKLRAFNGHFFHLLDFPREMATEGAALDNFREIDKHRNHPIFDELPATENAQDEVNQRISLNQRELDVYRNVLSDGGFLVAAMDITSRVRADAIIRQAQKMETVGHLTGGIAHDFNNLLQIISANLDLMTGDVQGNPRASGRLQNAISGVERGSRLTQQLLAFARRQPLNPQAINLGRAIQNMTDLLRRTLGERIDVEAVISGGLWNTLADPVQVENGILNLAINARDAMRDGGKLTIEVANAVLDDAYAMAHTEVTAGQYVMLAVSDTGDGMSPEVAARAFEPFFTTKREGEGTGLGLSQIYGFVKQSGGHIKIYSEVGHGTSVKLYLPRVRKGVDEYSTPLSPATGGTETILVVEDDAGVRAAAIDLLKELGYSVLKAENADEALALLESGARPDLLFTDVVMPGTINTRDFARQAQKICPDLLVLFTSGYTQNAIVHNGRLDADVFLLSKPYRKDELARKVRGILDGGLANTKTIAPSAAAQAERQKPLHILVVEDEMLVRMSTVDMLEQLGHRVMEVEDGPSALSALQADGKTELLITDLGLAGMSGQDLVAHVREQYPALKIIVASGYELPEEMASSGTVHLGKPFQLGDLKAAVARATTVSTED
ncbi:MAG TPA: CHASE3 domain-containing protein [Parvibaculum sp.]|jgi:signal transduction histidine kinase/CheY-like chemotaxis protein